VLLELLLNALKNAGWKPAPESAAWRHRRVL
jgi:hypothetical protein